MQKRLNLERPEDALLVLTPSVPAGRKSNLLFLDDKAISGLQLYRKFWPGRLRCIFREGSPTAIPFGSWQDPALLPFEIITIPEGANIPDLLLQDASVVLASGDNHLDFPMANQCRKLGLPLVFVIENTLTTRLQIIALSYTSILKRLKSTLWAIKTELNRRRVFSRADALQANGTPAADAYANVNPDILTFFDTRLSESMIPSQIDLAAKAAKRNSGKSLQLVFSGRLERIKGADHLLPLAERLISRGVNFRLDIFGTGSLAKPLRDAASRKDFASRVTIHEPLPFETELVPWIREHADLFVCCHRQSDPSCTYMETLGCGVPIVAYQNDAMEGILKIADAGWIVEKNDLDSLADKIAKLANDRGAISKKARAAVDLAVKHSFEMTFSNRVEQLKSIASRRCNSLH